MNLGIDCRALQEEFPSGVSQYTRGLVNALIAHPKAREWTITLFFNGSRFSQPDVRKKMTDLIEMPFSDSGPKVEWKFSQIPNKALTVATVFGQPRIDRLFGDVDAVLVPNLQFFPFSKSSVPVIQLLHDCSFVRMSDQQSIKSLLRHWFLQPQKQLQHAAEVVAVSKATGDDAKRLFGVTTKQLSVTYPGIPERPVKIGNDSVLTTAGINPASAVILAVGTIEPRKNIDALLRAFQKLREQQTGVQLVIVGKSGYRSSAVLMNESLMKDVIILDFCSDELLDALYQKATMSIYPSLFEGFGFPPLEAQRYGVPVIAGFHSSLQEVLKDSVLYADVLDVHALTRAMQSILLDQKLRSELIGKGVDNTKRFSWERAASRLIDSCERVLRD